MQSGSDGKMRRRDTEQFYDRVKSILANEFRKRQQWEFSQFCEATKAVQNRLQF